MAAEVMQGSAPIPQVLCRESLSDFSAKLYKHIYKQQGNIFFSPLSIATCLQMVYQGAGGNTKSQCCEVMGLTDVTDQDLLRFYKSILARLNEPDEFCSLTLANKVWMKDEMEGDQTVLEAYRDILVESLDAEIQKDAFSNPTVVAKDVNGWVENKTKGMIKELITPDMITPLTRLILCNAIYFKGLWANPFKKTKPEPFHLNAKEKVTVDMMRQESDMNYGETDLSRFVTLRYKGKRNLSMMVILPQVPFQLQAVEDEICKGGTIQTWFKLARRRKVNLALPKFNFEKMYDLKEILLSMGMSDMFSALANFEKINGLDEDDSDLRVTSCIHKAVFRMEEPLKRNYYISRLKQDIYIDFCVDEPFSFILLQKETVLFIGRCSDVL